MSRFSRIRRVDVTGSTNDDIARILGEADARGLTLVADYQTSGTGRKGRTWIASPGTSLLCTIALPEALRSADLWLVPFWIALAVNDALQKFGAHTTLQWPNDVLLENRKIAGILCVSRVTGEYAWAACGVGVNVTRPADGTAQAISPPPAFLSEVAAATRDDVLDALLRAADARYDDLWRPDAVVRDWQTAAEIPGRRYRIREDADAAAFEATALQLVTGGSLLVDAAGVRREISLADARVLRE